MKLLEQNVFRGKRFLCSYYYEYKSTNSFVHSHDFYEFFLTLSDDFKHYVNGSVEYLKKGTLVFIRPKDVHRNLFLDRIQSHAQLCFSSSIAESLFSFLGNNFHLTELLTSEVPPSIHLYDDDFLKLHNKFKDFNSSPHLSESAYSEYAKKMLFSLFTDYFNKYYNPNFQTIPRWLEHTVHIALKDNLYITNPEKIIEISGKTKKTLLNNLKKYYGLTFSQFITFHRLNYAHNMLKSTTMPILDICFECGFNTTSYFYKAYSKQFNESPSQTRKKSTIDF